ncbi:hypothetical protein [Pseudoblastomonas halimionae]|uniref:hypothetical protein n=1 Tax=Alteriqipengyuania halimionae TaxID=1926630 RepID=UPI0018F8C88A|nr:hypothetical protein [Alteriqipengyuania halimionae]
MIGKIIGAFVGGKAAQQSRGIDGPAGALIGVAAASALRRLSIPAMIALGAGGYLAKKYFDKQQAENDAPPALENRSPSTTKATTREPATV